MLKNYKKLSALLFVSIFLFSSVEANWITKKSDKSKEVIKEEKKQNNKWIKLKKKEIKANQKEFKENKKNISDETKKWITKKSKKDTYIQSIEEIPYNKDRIYLIANSLSTGKVIYGYVNWNDDKFKTSLDMANIKGKSYINDGKTICNIGIDINFGNKIIGTLNGDCTNKTQYNAVLEFADKQSAGLMVSSTGERFVFDLVSVKNDAIKKFASLKNNDQPYLPSPSGVTADITLNPTGKYYALLIGNSRYVKWSSLKSPVNDINEIHKVLEKKYSFEKVISVTNGTRKDIFKAIKELTKITTDKDYVLIYYSGHGDIRSNQSYWIPVDGAKDYDPTEWINIRDIEVYVENEISAHHLVVMVDSCYFAVASKGKTKVDNKNKSLAYSKLLNRRARIILSSGSNEPVEDTTEKHSKFAKSFIQSLKNNEKAIRLSEITENIFIDHAGSRQQPYHARMMKWGHGGGDFIFISKK